MRRYDHDGARGQEMEYCINRGIFLIPINRLLILRHCLVGTAMMSLFDGEEDDSRTDLGSSSYLKTSTFARPHTTSYRDVDNRDTLISLLQASPTRTVRGVK